jgi:hypothetical protein
VVSACTAFLFLITDALDAGRKVHRRCFGWCTQQIANRKLQITAACSSARRRAAVRSQRCAASSEQPAAFFALTDDAKDW